VAVEVPSNELSNALLVDLVQVLELVGGRELLYVETVGKDTIGFPLEQVLTLVCRNMTDGGEHVGAVGGTTFDAVSVVDATLSGFGVHVEILQVVVEIDGAGAEVATEKSSVSGEDGGHIDLALLAQGESDTSEPFVELCNDSPFFFVVDVLQNN
jgi:hypothetical protein